MRGFELPQECQSVPGSLPVQKCLKVVQRVFVTRIWALMVWDWEAMDRIFTNLEQICAASGAAMKRWSFFKQRRPDCYDPGPCQEAFSRFGGLVKNGRSWRMDGHGGSISLMRGFPPPRKFATLPKLPETCLTRTRHVLDFWFLSQGKLAKRKGPPQRFDDLEQNRFSDNLSDFYSFFTCFLAQLISLSKQKTKNWKTQLSKNGPQLSDPLPIFWDSKKLQKVKICSFSKILWRFSGEDSLKTHFENKNLEAWLRQETLFWHFKK